MANNITTTTVGDLLIHCEEGSPEYDESHGYEVIGPNFAIGISVYWARGSVEINVGGAGGGKPFPSPETVRRCIGVVLVLHLAHAR